MEKEYMFMKLSAVQCHMLKVVNGRGNMNSVDPNPWASLNVCLLLVTFCMQNSKQVLGRLPVLKRYCFSHQMNIFAMPPPCLTCYMSYCYLSHRTNK